MFIIENNNRIKITSGDSAYIELEIDGYNLKEGDTVYMSVGAMDIGGYIVEGDYLFQKKITEFSEDGNATIRIEPRDTKGSIGRYYYDVQVTLQNGDVYTVIPTNIFEILGGITNE